MTADPNPLSDDESRDMRPIAVMHRAVKHFKALADAERERADAAEKRCVELTAELKAIRDMTMAAAAGRLSR